MDKILVNNTDNYSISGWMINELKLNGNELLVYAIIYSYSRNKLNTFYGSLDYLSRYTNSDIRTVIRSIKRLLDKNYIIKLTDHKGYNANQYMANLDLDCIKKMNSNNENK